MTLTQPVRLGPGRRIRSLSLSDIDFVTLDPERSDPGRIRVVMKDSSCFWISSSAPGPGGGEFLRDLGRAFPPERRR